MKWGSVILEKEFISGEIISYNMEIFDNPEKLIVTFSDEEVNSLESCILIKINKFTNFEGCENTFDFTSYDFYQSFIKEIMTKNGLSSRNVVFIGSGTIVYSISKLFECSKVIEEITMLNDINIYDKITDIHINNDAITPKKTDLFVENLGDYSDLPNNIRIHFYDQKSMFHHLPYFETYEIILHLHNPHNYNLDKVKTIIRHLRRYKIEGCMEFNKLINFKKVNGRVHKKLKLKGHRKFNPTVDVIEYKDTSILNTKTFYYFPQNEFHGNKVLIGQNLKNYFISPNLSDAKIDRLSFIDEKLKVLEDSRVTCPIEKYHYAFNGKNIFPTTRNFPIYIYDFLKVGDKIHMKVLLGGYMKHDIKLSLNCDYTTLSNEDYKYYSPKSVDFPENFVTYVFEVKDKIVLSIDSNKELRVLTTKFASRKGMINSEFEFLVKDNTIRIGNNIYAGTNNNRNNVILFNDRKEQANDNAEHLYRYVMNNNILEKFNHYYVLSSKSLDYERLIEEGFQIIEPDSFEHKYLFLNASAVVSSHAAPRIYSPFSNMLSVNKITSYKFVFLQHGIIMGDHSKFLDVFNNKIDLFITSTKREKNLVEKFSGYQNIVDTGLPRFDSYKNVEEDNYILYAPSWNVKYRANFTESKYKAELAKVLTSDSIKKYLKKNNMKLKLLLHPEFANFTVLFSRYSDEYIEIIHSVDANYNTLLKECRALITDYSSILWDVLYMNKAVFLHQPYQLHHENFFNNEYMEFAPRSFNITQLENNVNYLIDSKHESEKLFTHNSNHCERIVKEIYDVLGEENE